MTWRFVVSGLCFMGLVANYAMRANMGIVVAKDGSLPLYDNRGMVLGAFLVGYAGIQLPSGLLARALGSRPVLLLSATLISLCDATTPAMAQCGLLGLLVCRLGAGGGGGD
mmetsp:Transcript_63802/g.128022  ORF Transcript_63802/g.128022 Transcript_63802/m.128022 type:complete len:111 (+) Transcript_63802:26-358(+)